MSASRTQTTTTSSSNAGPLGFCTLVPPANPASLEDEDLEEDEAEILRKAQEKVRWMKEKKAAAAAAAKQQAEEEAARKVAEEAREERRKRMAAAATARSPTGFFIRRDFGVSAATGSGDTEREGKRQREGKGPADLSTRIPMTAETMTTTKRIEPPANDAGSNGSLASLHLAREALLSVNPAMMPKSSAPIWESQVAQLLADNRQLRDGPVKAHTCHRHFNQKLDWLITDAARRGRSPPGIPEAGPLRVSRKKRKVVDSDEEEEQKIEEDREREVEEDGRGMEEEPAPMGAHSEKGKERAEE
ncbi:hypothetical protein EV359DRAFT_87157 [Lentinula novae-zelandiae]|nr:hypothetical protein EV359DRAFT_87157 [Lentinula novae-zelandiae]